MMFYPRLFKFPGGEEHVKLHEESHHYIREADDVCISHQLTTSSAVMQAFITTEAVRRVSPRPKISLFAPYFPYARQDRIMVPGESFTLGVFANLINSQNYNKVVILDPHSDVTPALVRNVNVIDNVEFVRESLDNLYETARINQKELLLVSPDAGAYKKVYNLAKQLDMTSYDIITGFKLRDVATGQIRKIGYTADVSVHSKVCVIVDDIIDGGATFTDLAKRLKADGAKMVILIVTHGIFSKGFDHLGVIDKIYTTDSFSTLPDDVLKRYSFVKQMKLSIYNRYIE